MKYTHSTPRFGACARARSARRPAGAARGRRAAPASGRLRSSQAEAVDRGCEGERWRQAPLHGPASACYVFSNSKLERIVSNFYFENLGYLDFFAFRLHSFFL